MEGGGGGEKIYMWDIFLLTFNQFLSLENGWLDTCKDITEFFSTCKNNKFFVDEANVRCLLFF